MTLVGIVAYVIVFGLPIWLVAEEILYRLVPDRKVEPAVRVRVTATAAVPKPLGRSAPKRVRPHASLV
jgi:hypothetical protein